MAQHLHFTSGGSETTLPVGNEAAVVWAQTSLRGICCKTALTGALSNDAIKRQVRSWCCSLLLSVVSNKLSSLCQAPEHSIGMYRLLMYQSPCKLVEQRHPGERRAVLPPKRAVHRSLAMISRQCTAHEPVQASVSPLWRVCRWCRPRR